MTDNNNNPHNNQAKNKLSKDEYQIGNYIIKKTLGQGTFGKVKLGIYIPTNEKYAIKILEKSKITEKDDEERVQREFKMLQEFNHPNVILVAEIFETKDRYYTVMDYCEGGELFNYIVKKRRLSEEEGSFFYYQIIKGLEYIHSLGIVHRDLKPENLLLNKNKILKIIDFGLSNFFTKNSKLLSTPCGSPCYASPEMVSGNKYNGFKIDVWATGIILFAMLCGYLPFEDKDNDILFKKIKECKIDFPHHLSPSSKDLMKKILVTNPDRRINVSEIKKHPFYLKGRTIFYQEFSVKKFVPKNLRIETDGNINNNNNNININSNDKRIGTEDNEKRNKKMDKDFLATLSNKEIKKKSESLENNNNKDNNNKNNNNKDNNNKNNNNNNNNNLKQKNKIIIIKIMLNHKN